MVKSHEHQHETETEHQHETETEHQHETETEHETEPQLKPAVDVGELNRLSPIALIDRRTIHFRSPIR